jgi:hypothetical protein
MARKWTVATAPRRVRLQWLKKAQKMRRYYARCRAKLGIPKHRAVPLTTRHTEYTIPRRSSLTTTAAPTLTAADLWEGPDEKPVHGPANWLRKTNSGMSEKVQPGARVSFVDHDGKIRTGRAVMRSSSGGWVLNMGGRYGTPAVVDDSSITRVSSRPRAKNPELLVVSNNPQRRKSTMRRRKSTPWSRLVKKYGVKGAKKHYHKGGGGGRRRRRRNSWRGHRAGHRRAALKGWRKRRRGGRKARGHRRGHRRGRRGGRRSRKSSSRPFKGAVKYQGRYWRKKTLKNKIGKRRLARLLTKRGRRSNRRRRFRRRN